MKLRPFQPLDLAGRGCQHIQTDYHNRNLSLKSRVANLVADNFSESITYMYIS